MSFKDMKMMGRQMGVRKVKLKYRRSVTRSKVGVGKEVHKV